MPKKRPTSLVPVERIEKCILLIRREKVMLDRDLAELYGVKPIALRQQVSRNIDRFPDDFMFRLTQEEANALVSQNVIPSKRSLGGSLPFVFTQGTCPKTGRHGEEVRHSFQSRLRRHSQAHGSAGTEKAASYRIPNSKGRLNRYSLRNPLPAVGFNSTATLLLPRQWRRFSEKALFDGKPTAENHRG